MARLSCPRFWHRLQTVQLPWKELRQSYSVSANVLKPAEENPNVTRNDAVKSSGTRDLTELRFKFPEFLPDPNPLHRNLLREKLERMDMAARRSVITIPEFYVGSIVAVTYSEKHAPDQLNKFVGICIKREGCGLRAKFILRNVIDGEGVEVIYDLYDPTIRSIQCLKLEKRLDDELLYLRDAPLEYSQVPVDMDPVYLPEGTPIPVNPIKVPLKPKPWLVKWELYNMKGIQEIVVSEKRRKKAEKAAKPWEKYDLMKIYRSTIPEEEQIEIFTEHYSQLVTQQRDRQKAARGTLSQLLKKQKKRTS